MTEWYYALPNTRDRCGPVPQEILRAMLDAGEIPFDSLVWREGLAGWTPARNLFAQAPAAPDAFGSGSGRLPLPSGLRGWLVFDGMVLVLLSILPSMFLFGIPLLVAGIAVLRASSALDPLRGIDAHALPFFAGLRSAAVAFGIFALLGFLVALLFLSVLAFSELLLANL